MRSLEELRAVVESGAIDTVIVAFTDSNAPFDGVATDYERARLFERG